MAILATTTLADLLTLPLVANPFSAMRTSLRWWSSDEFEDGVAHAWQNRLGRWPLIPFFPLLLEGGECWRKAYAIIVMSMTAKALPGSPLEVIETEFFSQLLVSPLANPSRLDGCLVISPSVAAFPSLGAVSSKSQQSMLSDFRAV